MRPIRAVLLCATFSGSSLTHTHTHIPVERPFFRDYPGEPVPERKPIWKQETVSGIRWTVCKSAPRSRQITTPAPYHSFLQAGCPSCGPTNSVKAVPTNRNYKYTQRCHISSSTRQSAGLQQNHGIIVNTVILGVLRSLANGLCTKSAKWSFFHADFALH